VTVLEPPSAVSLNVLDRLTDDTGMIEHGWYSLARYDSGYCTDDNGRALGLVCAIGGPAAAVYARRYLAFLYFAHLGGGRFRLRLGFDRRWSADPPSEDADGRALRGIGAAVARGPAPDIRKASRAMFDEGLDRTFEYWRAQAAALLGALDVIEAAPERSDVREAARRWAVGLPTPRIDRGWPWPDDRLEYENALLPHALIRAGEVLDEPAWVRAGVDLLGWLISIETQGAVFSFTPVGGRGPGATCCGFDQQPIEAWAMAEAAAVALRVTGDARFGEALDRAVAWFRGDNDVGVALVDPWTGGGHDGLESTGVNQNQGAESQLAALGVRHLERMTRPARLRRSLR